MEYGATLMFFLVVITILFRHTQTQFVPDSPCQDIFWYERDGSGKWYGLITAPNPYPYVAIEVIVSMYITDRVPPGKNAKLRLVNSNAWQDLAAGDRSPVQYRLDFPLSSPLPTIKDIRVNQRVICTGTKPRASYLTTLTIQHEIFNEKCSTSDLQCPFNNIQQLGGGGGGRPPSMPSFHPPAWDDDPPYMQILKPSEIQDSDYPTQQGTSSAPVSPCPDVFSYQRDSNGISYGLIKIPNPYPVVAINLKVEIYLTAFAGRGNNGDLKLVNDLKSEWNRMRTGERYSVAYRLSFPLQNPLPTVKSIIANNEVICRGSKPDSSRLSTFSFQHDIFHERCTSSSLSCPDNTLQIGQPVIPVKPMPPPQTQATPPWRPQPPPPTRRPETPPPTKRPETPPPTRRPDPPPTRRPDPPPTRRPDPPPTRQPNPPQPAVTDASSGGRCGNPIIRTNPLVFFGQHTERGQWPWHAAIYHLDGFDTKYICGGSFIGRRSILTAAHCMTNKGEALDAKRFLVYLGRYNLKDRKEQSDSQDMDVSDILIHPSFNYSSLQADVAVLILETAVTINNLVRPVCLWNHREVSLNTIIGKDGVVVGWGLDENGNTAEQLKMVKMPVVDQQTCIWSNRNFFSQFTSNTTFCAGFRNGSSVCNGDSGGGLVIPETQSDGAIVWMLRGIVSNSKPRENVAKLCDTKNYIIFTDAAQHLDWISAVYI